MVTHSQVNVTNSRKYQVSQQNAKNALVRWIILSVVYILIANDDFSWFEMGVKNKKWKQGQGLGYGSLPESRRLNPHLFFFYLLFSPTKRTPGTGFSLDTQNTD